MKKLLAYMFSFNLLLFTACNKENISNDIFNQDKPISALATAADNCATDGLIEKTITACGVERKFYIQLPVGFHPDSTYPLVFAFHGKGSGHKNKACAWKERIGEWVDENKFIGVYGRAYLDSFWYVHGACLEEIDDICYVENIKTNMESFYHIDASRIYAMGTSNGGGLTLDLSTQVNWLAAITTLAAYPWEVYPLDEVPVLPYFQIHGSLDGTIPYHGGTLFCLDFVDAYEACQDWATHNLCTATGIGTSFLIDTYVINKTSWCSPPVTPVLPVTCKKCKKETLHYELEGIGHTIYDQIAPIPGYKERINDDIFKFFKRHRL
ncbi:MAG: hypothetical protein JNK69_00890 [Saprospiraceae bacterium]|nr:hypothetical protein [Saprospiraceae bacterium]